MVFLQKSYKIVELIASDPVCIAYAIEWLQLISYSEASILMYLVLNVL